MERLWRQLRYIDRRISSFLEKEGLIVLRYSLAFVFICFGILKPLGLSPASELVANTVYWFDPAWFVPFLGWWEVAIGLCFLYRPLIRVAIAFLAPQMLGTFLPLVLLPDIAFNGFPVPSMEGQYILKNLIIIGAAMVVGGIVRD